MRGQKKSPKEVTSKLRHKFPVEVSLRPGEVRGWSRMWYYRHRVRSCVLEEWRENPEKVVKKEGGFSEKLCLSFANVIQMLLCFGY